MSAPDKFGHVTRYSDSSLYDERCTLCGGTDRRGSDALDKPCPNAMTPSTTPSTTPVPVEALEDRLYQAATKWRADNYTAIQKIPSDDGPKWDAFAAANPVPIDVHDVWAAVDALKACKWQSAAMLSAAPQPVQGIEAEELARAVERLNRLADDIEVGSKNRAAIRLVLSRLTPEGEETTCETCSGDGDVKAARPFRASTCPTCNGRGSVTATADLAGKGGAG